MIFAWLQNTLFLSFGAQKNLKAESISPTFRLLGFRGSMPTAMRNGQANVCQLKLNGNMHRGVDWSIKIFQWETRPIRQMPITGRNTKVLLRSGRFNPMVLGYMIWPGMFGSGFRITMEANIIRHHPIIIRKVPNRVDLK